MFSPKKTPSKKLEAKTNTAVPDPEPQVLQSMRRPIKPDPELQVTSSMRRQILAQQNEAEYINVSSGDEDDNY
jgi:hypothetical protein